MFMKYTNVGELESKTVLGSESPRKFAPPKLLPSRDKDWVLGWYFTKRSWLLSEKSIR